MCWLKVRVCTFVALLAVCCECCVLLTSGAYSCSTIFTRQFEAKSKFAVFLMITSISTSALCDTSVLLSVFVSCDEARRPTQINEILSENLFLQQSALSSHYREILRKSPHSFLIKNVFNRHRFWLLYFSGL